MSSEDSARAQQSAQASAAAAAEARPVARPVATVTGPRRTTAPAAVLGARTQEIAREVVEQQAQRAADAAPDAEPVRAAAPASASQPAQAQSVAQRQAAARQQVYARQQAIARHQAMAQQQAAARQLVAEAQQAQQQAAVQAQRSAQAQQAHAAAQAQRQAQAQQAQQAAAQAQQAQQHAPQVPQARPQQHTLAPGQGQTEQQAAAQREAARKAAAYRAQQAQAQALAQQQARGQAIGQTQAQARSQAQAQALGRAQAAPLSPPPAPLPVAKTEVIGGEVALPPRADTAKNFIAKLPMMRMVWWELAVVLGLLAIGKPWPVIASLATGGVIMLALTAVRWRGSWLSSLVERRLKLAARRQPMELPPYGDTSSALLDVIAPDATIDTMEVGGVPVGVIGREGELLTVLRPEETPTPSFAAAALSEWLMPDQDPEMPELKLQLVLHHGPQAEESQRGWIAVRVMREVESAFNEELRVALSNTIRRMQRRLKQAGLGARVLTEQEIRATLTALTHTGAGRGAVAEDWQYWRTGNVNQVTLRLHGVDTWSGHHRLPVIQRMLSAVPTVAATIAVTASDPESHAVLRIASTTETAVNEAADHLIQLAPSMGVRLERLDGMHAVAVAASLPIGGNLT